MAEKRFTQEFDYHSPLAVNNQLYFCAVPFRMDSYSGCSFKCSYCFVRSAELTSASRKNHGNHIIAAEDKEIKRMMNLALDTNETREDINIEWLRRRVPIHWGGMSDPFQPIEKKYNVSLKILEYVNWYQYPVVISTKGIMCSQEPYLSLLGKSKVMVQTSLVCDNDKFIKVLEPGAYSATERLKSIEKMSNAGIYTAVRIQPVIPNSIVEWDMPKFFKRLSDIGVRHVVTEGFKLPARNPDCAEAIRQIAPEAIELYNSPDIKFEGFEKLLPSYRKWKYVKLARNLCLEYGMTFGAGDNDMRDFGTTISCCGTDNLPGFENQWKYQASNAAFIAKEKPNNIVTLEDLDCYWFGEKEFPVHNDIIRNKSESDGVKSTPKYCVETMWERGGTMSPECMANMHKVSTLNSKGELVTGYKWVNSVNEFEQNGNMQKKMF